LYTKPPEVAPLKVQFMSVPAEQLVPFERQMVVPLATKLPNTPLLAKRLVLDAVADA
jgi:hypothetical protein